MADGKSKKDGKGKGKAKKPSLIDRIRKLITDDPDSGDATGSGGRTRQRNIDSIVDAAQSGIDEADEANRRR